MKLGNAAAKCIGNVTVGNPVARNYFAGELSRVWEQT